MEATTTDQLATNTFPLQLRKGEQISPEHHAAICDILRGDAWTAEQFAALSWEEQKKISQVIQTGINSLAFHDRDQFRQRMDAVILESSKQDIWEVNHANIISALSELTKKLGRFPKRYEIAQETGLSRPTINSHLKEYLSGEQHRKRQEELAGLRDKVLARIYTFAVNGDVRAAKVFLDATAPQPEQAPAPRINNQQNNFIQINGMTVTQEQLAELPEDKQAILQELLRGIPAPQTLPA